MKPLNGEDFPLYGRRLIEASAGTGKTHTITNLYLRLLLGRDTAPRKVSEILVLTFTVAATEELRGRIRKRVAEARRALAAGASKDNFLAWLIDTSPDALHDSRILSASLQLMDEASIFTIHGFCARVLHDHAFETATLFSQNLDADRDLLLSAAAEDCFRAFVLTQPPLIRHTALSLWKSPADLKNKLGGFLFRHNLTLLPPYRALPFDELADKIRTAKRRWLKESFETAIMDAQVYASSPAVKALPEMTDWCAGGDLETDLWSNWTSAALAKVKVRKGGHRPSHPLVELIDEICADLQQIRYNLWHDATRIVRENLARYKAEFGQLTLDDLLANVHQALFDSGTGPGLAKQLAERWPISLIDEFQDTDDIQYEIFERIYRDCADTGLVFIGDPKQAIYQFRGADVYTYINARRAVAGRDIFSLVTNWRSSAAMVEAVNLLFDRENIFGSDEDMPFERVSASAEADKRLFLDGAKTPAPVTLFQISGEELNADQARRLAMGAAAEETSRLLTAASRNDAMIDGAPLRAGQIAFLVRSRAHAEAARDALLERGIRSVYVTQDSVFATDTADDLYLIMRAVLEHTNERALHTALAVPLMQATAAEIDEISRDFIAEQALLDEFSAYHDIWVGADIATMISKLMTRRKLAQQWLGKPNGERQITNLRHLSELLQHQAAVSPGMRQLLSWFAEQRRGTEILAAEDRQLRLESDRNLVQIVTMHAAKGLEYEVVMIPEASFGAHSNAGRSPFLFHESNNNHFHTCIDFSDNDISKERSRAEQAEEDLRLLYVAITRAKHKCYIGFANRDLGKIALRKLLPVENDDADSVETWLRDNLREDLFDVRRVTEVAVTPCSLAMPSENLKAPGPPPDTRSHWRLHSYTGIARRISFEEEDGEPGEFRPGFGDDELEPSPTPAYGFSRFTFPRGPRAGVALHALLESLDFSRPIAEQAEAVNLCLGRTGLVRNLENWSTVLTDWMTDVLATPLNIEANLAGVARSHRLDELEFHFPMDTDARLLDVLNSAGYLHRSSTLRVETLQGMMTGLIDLVFGAGGRYYLVDYKSNFLGNAFSDYAAPHLHEAVKHHQYDLQYLIYCVALTRYLRRRLPGFDYERDFGGVYYLFLRGMNGQDADTGVFFDKPDAAMLELLDNTLGGTR